VNAPTVLAVLVVHNGSAWIQRVLSSLARQTHARLGVLAIDNGSTDGSAETLDRVLGARRVVRSSVNHGFPAAMRRAMELPAAKEADYLLFLHDDTALQPDAVAQLVEAAQRMEGAGIVGPKVLDWDDPSVLREVGFAADRFGFPHSPLEADEIDQGQYDAPREVLFVSSAAMLVSREAWTRIGPPDDRLAPAHGDLGYGWRARVAGYRVVVSPTAVAFHRTASARGERGGGGGERYHLERAALATLLTNQRLLTLVWLLPVFAVQGVVRLILALFSRRFDQAGQMLAAWGWNVVHLPGTIARRARVQAARRVSDHEISRFMTAGSPIQRWLQQGSTLLTGTKAASVEEGEEPEDLPLRERVASLFVAHPVAVGVTVALLLTLVAFRGVLFATSIEGGAFPVMPRSLGTFFRELGSSWRTFGFGGPTSPSPALALLGAGSFVTFGSPAILGKVLVAFTPFLAGITCYRGITRLRVPGVSAVTAATAYALSSLTLWTSSEGRLGEAALLIALPWLWGRAVDAFGDRPPAHPWRWAVATGMGLALATALFPSTWIALIGLVLPLVLIPERGGSVLRGLGLVALSTVAATALLFPFVLTLVVAGGDGVVHPGITRALDLLRLAPGPAPGTGPAAFFLPLAALLSFAVIESTAARAAWRALIMIVVTVPCAWLAAAGYLPETAAVPSVFLALAAFSMAALVGLATDSLFVSVRRTAFGTRQVVVAVLGIVLGVGIVAQSLSILPGDWAVGEDRVAPAWPVVASSDPAGGFRALWLRRADGRPFAPPGGDPQGVVAAGSASVSYGVTGRGGRSVLAIGTPAAGDAYDALEGALAAILTGRSRHGGALLAPFAVRFVVAQPGTLPPAASSRLADQVDIDLVQRAGGLLLFRNAEALPEAAALPPEAADVLRRDDLLAPTEIDAGVAQPLRGGGDRWTGTAPAGATVLVTDEYHEEWGSGTFPAFGWALGATSPGGTVDLRYGGRVSWLLQVGGLAVLWLLALWVVRRRPGEEAERRARSVRRTADVSRVGAR
jgi:GT2 family glycosyltransferase